MRLLKTSMVFMMTFFLQLVIISTSQAGTITIDFESITTGIRTSPTSFLSGYGIPSVTASGVGGGGPWVIDVSIYPTLYTAPSGNNVLVQSYTSTSSGQQQSLTFLFTPELLSFSLSRIGLVRATSPVWNAFFYNSSSSLLGSFGELALSSSSTAKTFSFIAPAGQTIASMVLTSTWTGTSSMRNIAVDDFVLTTPDIPIPEPATMLLLGTGLVGVAGAVRRRKRNRT